MNKYVQYIDDENKELTIDTTHYLFSHFRSSDGRASWSAMV